MRPLDRWGKGGRHHGWQILDGMLCASDIKGSARYVIPIDRIDVVEYGDGHRENLKADFSIVYTGAGAYKLDVPHVELLAAMAEMRGGNRGSIMDYMGTGPHESKWTNHALR